MLYIIILVSTTRTQPGHSHIGYNFCPNFATLLDGQISYIRLKISRVWEKIIHTHTILQLCARLVHFYRTPMTTSRDSTEMKWKNFSFCAHIQSRTLVGRFGISHIIYIFQRSVLVGADYYAVKLWTCDSKEAPKKYMKNFCEINCASSANKFMEKCHVCGDDAIGI